ncbi:damage-control phosphatase ARMT1-like [Schistocerca americana]|uniref:damage-control phosphatase ARMT1-like n=1 Tax=Schistocerca americana TaxID=7009 RepID=UPI001F4F6A8F|nr:damage-control phosphatase ARMT1-like [Schistocerca americana]XP_049948057.1 damage-control phosphatase ARMT1-like [Schistocerca serialis cubense]
MPTPTVVDAETPVGLPLSARFRQSFAYFSMTSRNPDILEHTMASLRESPPGGADVETLCKELSQLLEEMRGDASWPQLTSTAGDAALWNKLLRAAGCACSRHWLTAPWIVAESYMYRRVRQATEASALADPAQPPDPFLPVKQKTFAAGMPAIQALAEWMAEAGTSREDLSRLLKTATRANAADLSLSAGVVLDQDELTAITAPSDDAFIADQSETVWTVLQSGAGCVTVDLVCDNMGYELFADLCLAQLLTTLGATRVRIHLKAHPYYVSDATMDDLQYLLEQLTTGDAPEAARLLAVDWKGRLQDGGPWIASAEYFWTLPLTYDRMPKEDPKLYAELQESALAIFKGDVNFRKLVGDLRWPVETRLEHAVRGFRPCPMAALRTIKSETAVGLKPGQEKQLDASQPGWMTSGQLALIVCVPEFI